MIQFLTCAFILFRMVRLVDDKSPTVTVNGSLEGEVVDRTPNFHT